MKKSLLLALSLLVAGSTLVPSETQALSQNQITGLVALTGPAAFGLYKLGSFIKRNKTAQKAAKYVGKGLGTLICAGGAARLAAAVASNIKDVEHCITFANRLPSYDPNYTFYLQQARSETNASYFNTCGSLALGLAACFLAQSLISDVKTDINNPK